MERISLMAGIIIISLAAFSFTHAAFSGKPDPKTTHAALNTIPSGNSFPPGDGLDSVTPRSKNKDQNFDLQGVYNGKAYKAKMVNGQIKYLYIDGKKIPAEKYPTYKPEIDKLFSEFNRNSLNLAKDREKLEKERLALESDQIKLSLQQADMLRDQVLLQGDSLPKLIASKAEELKFQQEALAAQNLILSKKMDDLRNQDQLKMLKEQSEQLAMIQNEVQQNLVRDLKVEQSNLTRKQIDEVNRTIKKEVEKVSKEVKQLEMRKEILSSLASQNSVMATQAIAEKLKAEAMTPPVTPVAPVPQAAPEAPVLRLNKPIANIMEDLLTDRIINREDNISFTLNSEMFEVNGIAQPQDVHQKYRDKYIKGINDHVIYSNANGSTHADVSTGN